MKSSMRNGIILLITFASAAYASHKNQPEESVLLLWGFLAFIGSIIVFQFLPGISLFSGMIKGLFGGHEQDSDYAPLAKGKE